MIQLGSGLKSTQLGGAEWPLRHAKWSAFSVLNIELALPSLESLRSLSCKYEEMTHVATIATLRWGQQARGGSDL